MRRCWESRRLCVATVVYDFVVVVAAVPLLETLGSSVSVLKPLLSPLQAQQRRTLSVSCLPQDLALIAPTQMTARHLLGDSWSALCPSG